MEKYEFSAEKELIRSDRIARSTYVLNLSALIITMALCLLLFRIL